MYELSKSSSSSAVFVVDKFLQIGTVKVFEAGTLREMLSMLCW